MRNNRAIFQSVFGTNVVKHAQKKYLKQREEHAKLCQKVMSEVAETISIAIQRKFAEDGIGADTVRKICDVVEERSKKFIDTYNADGNLIRARVELMTDVESILPEETEWCPYAFELSEAGQDVTDAAMMSAARTTRIWCYAAHSVLGYGMEENRALIEGARAIFETSRTEQM